VPYSHATRMSSSVSSIDVRRIVGGAEALDAHAAPIPFEVTGEERPHSCVQVWKAANARINMPTVTVSVRCGTILIT